MILSDSQWRELKKIRWDPKESKRIQTSVYDDKLVVGWHSQSSNWVLGRLCDVTVLVQFGVRKVPTREQAPIVWKHWLDDDGTPLNIRDPRLVPYIRRCDLWRMGIDKYMVQFDKQDWIDDQKERSEEDDLGYIAKHLVYPRIKEEADKMCGYTNRSPIERKWHVPQAWKPHWEKTHDKQVA